MTGRYARVGQDFSGSQLLWFHADLLSPGEPASGVASSGAASCSALCVCVCVCVCVCTVDICVCVCMLLLCLWVDGDIIDICVCAGACNY